MKVSDFDFHLPEELIGQTPYKDRDQCRLLVMDKKTGEIEHKHFYDIYDQLQKGDTLVLNDTRVIPARLIGEKEDTKGKMEFLLLKRIDKDKWQTLVKPGKRAKIGTTFVFGDGLLKAKVVDISDEGSRIVEFSYEGIFEEVLDKLGEMPLPPYITEKLEDKEAYQTVYSKNSGSAAAPTAGLHFTEELLERIKEKGINIVYVTLHVGLGTFRPVKEENIENHKMHSEYFECSEQTAMLIEKTKSSGGRVICVGTTSCRVIESIYKNFGKIKPCSMSTDIFIKPGHKFGIMDGLITNFHLPESTLIILVCAFAGYKNTMNAYKEAVQKEYRFFSFGDAMMII